MDLRTNSNYVAFSFTCLFRFNKPEAMSLLSCKIAYLDTNF
jgi:hypothetical protein